MPEICRFYGIVVAMFNNEHNPPHFHVRYGKDQAAIEIRTLRILEGWVPPRAIGLVMEWAADHREDLLQDWEQARNGETLKKIDPL